MYPDFHHLEKIDWKFPGSNGRNMCEKLDLKFRSLEEKHFYNFKKKL
jgi:hypothetical protein